MEMIFRLRGWAVKSPGRSAALQDPLTEDTPSGLSDPYLQLSVEQWGMMDFKCMDEIVEAGYLSSLEQLKELP